MNVANAVTGSRLIFFTLFVGFVVQDRLPLAAVMFLFAWGLDAIDGWIARHFSQATAFGYLFDKVVDRFVLATGILTIVAAGVVPPLALLLATKDVLTAPVAVWAGMRDIHFQDLGWLGKMASVFQGTGVVWLLLNWPYAEAVILFVAAFGLVVGLQFTRAVTHSRT